MDRAGRGDYRPRITRLKKKRTFGMQHTRADGMILAPRRPARRHACDGVARGRTSRGAGET